MPDTIVFPGFIMGNIFAADVTFHTNDEDKDDDTQVTVKVFDSSGQLYSSA